MVSSFVPIALCERQFPQKCAVHGLRVDGREVLEAREIEIQFMDYGTVQLRFGKTRVLAACAAWVGEPRADRPNEGYLQINSDFSRMCVPADTRIPVAKAVTVNRILERAFRESHCVDLESLCIVAASVVWNLRVDLTVLDYDGSVLDALVLATTLSLAHFRLPNHTVTSDEVSGGSRVEVSANWRDSVSTPLRFRPVAATVALLGDGRAGRAGGTLFLDANGTEEQVASGCVLFVANKYKQLCVVQTLTAARFGASLLQRCSKAALDRCEELVRLCDEALARDAEQREGAQTLPVCSDFTFRYGLSSASRERKASFPPHKTALASSFGPDEHEEDLLDDYESESEDEDAEVAPESQSRPVLFAVPAEVKMLVDTEGNASVAGSEQLVDHAETYSSDSEESIVQELQL